MPQGDKKPRPTVIGPPGTSVRKMTAAGARKAAAPDGPRSSSGAAVAVRQPTAIPGSEPRRIEVPPGELERLSPGASADACVQARGLIGTLVADKLTERKAILWGHDLQQAYSALVSEAFALSRSPVLRKVEGYLSRTMDILGSIDLLAACGHGSSGLLGRMFQRINPRIDTPGELAQAQAELENLVALMAAALQELLDLKDQLLRVAERTAAVAAPLEAAALAASFLSRHLQPGKDAVAQRFGERAMSLTQTLAMIREGDVTRSLQAEQPIRMIGAIQDVALVMLPGFVGSMASLCALTTARTPVTPTEAGELAYRLSDLVERLKSSTGWQTGVAMNRGG